MKRIYRSLGLPEDSSAAHDVLEESIIRRHNMVLLEDDAEEPWPRETLKGMRYGATDPCKPVLRALAVWTWRQRQPGSRPSASCEWADYPYSILERHWPGCAEVPGHHHIYEGGVFEKTGLETVTIISGGFPCQPFSTAGKRRGFADERYLWPRCAELLPTAAPLGAWGKCCWLHQYGARQNDF